MLLVWPLPGPPNPVERFRTQWTGITPVPAHPLSYAIRNQLGTIKDYRPNIGLTLALDNVLLPLR